MKNCKHEGCTKQVEDKYEYCLDHYQKPSSTWHADPVVDQLMKINSNLNAIKGALLSIAYNTSKDE